MEDTGAPSMPTFRGGFVMSDTGSVVDSRIACDAKELRSYRGTVATSV